MDILSTVSSECEKVPESLQWEVKRGLQGGAPESVRSHEKGKDRRIATEERVPLHQKHKRKNENT